MTDNLIAQAEAALDVIHRLSQAQGYDGDAVGCALCTDADAAIWHNDEPICQDCANRIMERAHESAGVSALIARIRELEGANRELALDVLAASGQAQEAYEAQLAAEAKLVEVEKERDRWEAAAQNHARWQIAAEATVATLTAQVEAMRGALEYYKDTFCEGFCGEDCWSDEGHSHPDLQRDCSGCLAASVLIRAALTTEKTNG